jgi:hypothetical protein
MKRDGVIIFSTGHDLPKWFFDIYKKVTGCETTHVGIICKDWFYESTIKIEKNIITYGVRKQAISVFSKNCLKLDRDLTDIEIEKMYNYLESMVGVHYNTLKLMNILILRYFSWFWKLIKWTPFSKKAFGVICSELVDKTYKQIGIDLLPMSDENLTTPCDIMMSKKMRNF